MLGNNGRVLHQILHIRHNDIFDFTHRYLLHTSGKKVVELHASCTKSSMKTIFFMN